MYNSYNSCKLSFRKLYVSSRWTINESRAGGNFRFFASSTYGETFENRDPSARRTFFDPAPPSFAAKTKLALRAQTVAFAGAEAAGAGAPKNMKRRPRAALPGKEAVCFFIALLIHACKAGIRDALPVQCALPGSDFQVAQRSHGFIYD